MNTYIGYDDIKNRYPFSGIFSDVDINFHADDVSTVTSLTLDSIKDSRRSTEKLPTQINQLLVDIQSMDDGELARAYRTAKELKQSVEDIVFQERMLDTQKAQIELLSRLMSATETLTTKEELTEYMNEQLNILTENNAQCQAAVTEFQNKMRKSAAEFTDSMKTAVSDTEKRVGRISDFYSNNLSMLTDTAEKYLSRIFWITVIPSAITALYYLTLLILRLI